MIRLQRMGFSGILLASLIAAIFWSTAAFSKCLEDTIDPHIEYMYDTSQNHLSETQTCPSDNVVNKASCQCFTLSASEASALLQQPVEEPVAVGVFTAPDFTFSGECKSGLEACHVVCATLANDSECKAYVNAGLNQ